MATITNRLQVQHVDLDASSDQLVELHRGSQALGLQLVGPKEDQKIRVFLWVNAAAPKATHKFLVLRSRDSADRTRFEQYVGSVHDGEQDYHVFFLGAK